MPVRLSKILAVAAIAFFASLVVFGNISDYATNFAFVSHVMAMDTIYPTARITYRAIHTPALQHAFYALIIAAEAATALAGNHNVLRQLRNLPQHGLRVVGGDEALLRHS